MYVCMYVSMYLCIYVLPQIRAVFLGVNLMSVVSFVGPYWGRRCLEIIMLVCIYDHGPGDPSPPPPPMVWSPLSSPNLSKVPAVTGTGPLAVAIL